MLIVSNGLKLLLMLQKKHCLKWARCKSLRTCLKGLFELRERERERERESGGE